MTTALLIVDMQKAFFQDDHLGRRRTELVTACNHLIAQARQYDCLIITARTVHRPDRSTWTLNMLDDDGGFLLAGDEEAAYLEGLDTDGVHEIIKTRDSAFWQTGLLDYLHQQGIDRLVLAGVSTHQCVTQTAVDAYNANLRVELAIDAIATEEPAMHQLFLDFLHRKYRMPRRHTADVMWRTD